MPTYNLYDQSKPQKEISAISLAREASEHSILKAPYVPLQAIQNPASAHLLRSWHTPPGWMLRLPKDWNCWKHAAVRARLDAAQLGAMARLPHLNDAALWSVHSQAQLLSCATHLHCASRNTSCSGSACPQLALQMISAGPSEIALLCFMRLLCLLPVGTAILRLCMLGSLVGVWL